jgi:DNA modification methylase
VTYVIGDALTELRRLPDGYAQTCVTSPPYWGLRDYGHPKQLGQEATPAEYVEALVEVLAEVRRVLRDDGTLWLVIGDSYAGARGGAQGKNSHFAGRAAAREDVRKRETTRMGDGLKHKDLVGVPWRVALALQNDGWWLRSEIIWHKPSPMPESVADRPTRAHETIFLLSKSKCYYYDNVAVQESARSTRHSGNGYKRPARALPGNEVRGSDERWQPTAKRELRSVWSCASQPYDGAHFACFPPKLIVPCILAGAPLGGMVLDPFLGSGTTGMVAEQLGRRWFGIELQPAYEALIRDRTAQLELLQRGLDAAGGPS